MKQGYITYYEGYNKDGVVIFNGNHTATTEYEDYVNPEKLLDSMVEYIQEAAKSKNPLVVRCVIKGLFKL